MFLWIRWRIGQMECHISSTCYAGSVVELNPLTLWNNFTGALPGRTGQFVVEEALASGRDIPNINSLSVAVALVGAIAVAGLILSWSIRASDLNGDSGINSGRAGEYVDIRGLAKVIIVALAIAVGSAGISGITARAVDLLQSSMLSYRSGVIIWWGLSLAIVAGVAILMLSKMRLIRVIGLTTMLVVLVAGISLYLPRNIESAQAVRSEARTYSINAIHQELALGDLSSAGDQRRCETLSAHKATYSKDSATFTRTISAAYAAFDYYFDVPYCSTGEGLVEE